MIYTMGEMIVEIMREKEDAPLDKAGVFLGPYPSGAPAIFISTAARLNHKSGIISGVGDDDFGKCLLDRLKKDGVDVSNVLIDKTTSTGCAFVTYFKDGERKFIFHIGNTPAAKAVPLSENDTPDADFFHVMGCSLMSSESFGREIVKQAKAFKDRGAKISFDPNIRPELLGNADAVDEIFKITNVFMPGVSEILSFTGKDNVEDAVTECFKNENIEIIALKNGSKGCRIFARTESFEQGIYNVNVKDATGAGDSFDAAFICSLIDKKPLTECAKIASAAAALNTAAFGPMEGDISPENICKMINS